MLENYFSGVGEHSELSKLALLEVLTFLEVSLTRKLGSFEPFAFVKIYLEFFYLGMKFVRAKKKHPAYFPHLVH